MDELGKALQRQIGPFAVWQWVAIAVGGVGLGLVLTRAFGTDDGAPAPSVAGSAGGAVVGSGGPAIAGNAGGAVTYLPDGSVDPAPLRRPETNQEWAAAAFAAVSASTEIPAFEIEQALSRYLSGLSRPDDQTVISLALEAVGVPPDGAPLTLPDLPAGPDPLEPTPYPEPPPPPAPPAPTTPAPTPVAPAPTQPAPTTSGPAPSGPVSPSQVLIIRATGRESAETLAQRYYRTRDARVVQGIQRRNGYPTGRPRLLLSRGDLIRLAPNFGADYPRRRHRP